ncbi:MAG: adenylate cyclase [Clostridia bacterium]|nr:adenylate cyclase [Clostridia bacterium]
MNEIHSTNLRLNMGKESHRKAWEYLQTMDKGQYKSYSNVIAMALVELFERKAKLQDDPYFETREREERFIRQIISEVEKALDKVLPVYLAGFMSAYPARQKATMIQPNL